MSKHNERDYIIAILILLITILILIILPYLPIR